jgi:1-acyl-sn-glycerol-3-phosphate acyltransferase
MTLIARFIFWLYGWKIGQMPENYPKKWVVIASPHTSNWDFVFMRAAMLILGIPIRVTLKDQFMRFPLNLIFAPLGAIGINRRPRKPGEERPSTVQAMADLFKDREELAMVVTPEGSRSLRTTWKTGFYHVAQLANVPIGLGYLDFAKKEAGIGGIIYPSGDMEADLRKIMAFYQTITPKHPEKFSIDVAYQPNKND